MKKLLLGLGAIASVVAPVATMVACGSNDSDDKGVALDTKFVAPLKASFVNMKLKGTTGDFRPFQKMGDSETTISVDKDNKKISFIRGESGVTYKFVLSPTDESEKLFANGKDVSAKFDGWGATGELGGLLGQELGLTDTPTSSDEL